MGSRRTWPGALLLLLLGAGTGVQARTRSPHGELVPACTDCHTTAGWHAVVFDHDPTGFVLEGRHAGAACLDCHRVASFAADPACLGCHADYHESALGTDCGRCHTPTAWRATRFDHEDTSFPLWGAHQAAACIQCHADERSYQLAPLPETCIDCHEAVFRRAPVSVHVTAGPDCETCHTLDTWRGGHDPAWFEIRRGRHELPCGRCHKLEPDYATYTCTDCHRFSQRGGDDDD